jgi:hypothetical protein
MEQEKFCGREGREEISIYTHEKKSKQRATLMTICSGKLLEKFLYTTVKMRIVLT